MVTIAKGRIKHIHVKSGQGPSQPQATNEDRCLEGDTVLQQVHVRFTRPMSSEIIQFQVETRLTCSKSNGNSAWTFHSSLPRDLHVPIPHSPYNLLTCSHPMGDTPQRWSDSINKYMSYSCDCHVTQRSLNP